MEGPFEACLATLFGNLDSLPLEQEDRTLIKQIVLRRLMSKGAVKQDASSSLNKLARDIFRISHQRNDALGPGTCPDPEWNMLMDLLVAHTEGRPTYVSSLCIASGVPTATAIRRIDHMADRGLIKRRACRNDKRRIWVEATPHALDTTETLLRMVYEAG